MSSLSFSSDLVRGVQVRSSAEARNKGGSLRGKTKKKVSFWCLSCLTPSVTLVVICVSRTFCSTDQGKRETATAENSFYVKLSQGFTHLQCLQVLLLFFESRNFESTDDTREVTY